MYTRKILILALATSGLMLVSQSVRSDAFANPKNLQVLPSDISTEGAQIRPFIFFVDWSSNFLKVRFMPANWSWRRMVASTSEEDGDLSPTDCS